MQQSLEAEAGDQLFRAPSVKLLRAAVIKLDTRPRAVRHLLEKRNRIARVFHSGYHSCVTYVRLKERVSASTANTVVKASDPHQGDLG